MKLSIIGGRVLDPAQHLDEVQDIHIENGRILDIGPAPAGFQPDRTLHAEGLLVVPGFIDLATHLREPGPSYKGSLYSETRAGLAGGYTTLCARPDTSPVVDSAAVVRVVQEKAEAARHTRVLTLGALTQGLEGQLLANMSSLQNAGCVAVTNMHSPIRDHRVLLRALEYAATYDLRVFFYSQDPDLAADGCAHDGPLAARLGLGGIPETAETVALARDLLLVEQTGVQAHFGMLSSARSVDMVRSAQARGLPVTCDVSMAHLHYTDAQLAGFNSLFHLVPPLRSEFDRFGLLQGVRDGVVTAISSAHLPHEAAAKKAPFAASEPGMSTLETVFSQGLQLVERDELSLIQLISSLTDGPAEMLGLEAGALYPGYAADLALLDLEAEWTPNAETLCSAGHNMPGLDRPHQGRINATLIGGEIRYRHPQWQDDSALSP